MVLLLLSNVVVIALLRLLFARWGGGQDGSRASSRLTVRFRRKIFCPSSFLGRIMCFSFSALPPVRRFVAAEMRKRAGIALTWIHQRERSCRKPPHLQTGVFDDRAAAVWCRWGDVPPVAGLVDGPVPMPAAVADFAGDVSPTPRRGGRAFARGTLPPESISGRPSMPLPALLWGPCWVPQR